MSFGEVIADLVKAPTLPAFLKQHSEPTVRDLLKEYLPKSTLAERHSLQALSHDPELFPTLQKIFQLHNQLVAGVTSLAQRQDSRPQQLVGKKITRAALARRHEKTQEEMRKDQIFVRLTPKSQACIQFMLCNRNFPRMECKLSCNQHLEYLVNYLTQKWIRGKTAECKVLLFADGGSFLKGNPMGMERERAVREPLNTYLMFTDVMAGCGVGQNGVLNLNYDIVEVKKSKNNHTPPAEVKVDYSPPNHGHNRQASPVKQPHMAMGKPNGSNHSPNNSHFAQKQAQQQGQYLSPPNPKHASQLSHHHNEGSLFGRNNSGNYYNQESLFGSLGFNFHFGLNTVKKEEGLISINSMNYMDIGAVNEGKAHVEPSEHFKNSNSKELSTPKKKPESNSGLSQSRPNKAIKREDSQSNFGIQVFSPSVEPQEKKESPGSSESQKGAGDAKLGALVSFLDEIQGQQQELGLAQEDNNNSNKPKDVKTVSIVKKKNN